MQSVCGWGRDRTSAEYEIPRSYPDRVQMGHVKRKLNREWEQQPE